MKRSFLISGTTFALLLIVFGLLFNFNVSVVSMSALADFLNHETTIPENLHPGAEEYGTVLTEKIDAMKENRGPSYKPRTKHLKQNGDAKYTNRLFLESSPYLLQHAHNPVNWYPWGEEAFEEARRLNRPLFVSIGYSTCHWCHVMEEESFEDVEIAEFLNSHYIPVKVDREERPDVDAVYMSAVQLLTGRGGWPLNVWLTPDMKPFYGGTYFPARDGDRGPATGFLTFLKKISESYHSQRQLIDQSGDNLSVYINKILQPEPGSNISSQSLITESAELFKKMYDPVYGGVQGEPKFPSSFHSRLMLRHHLKAGDSEALEMAVHTLVKMADGGMYDQAGGGFHRYSTDKKWLVPHFEKMLYDNALLAITYLEAYQASGIKRFRNVCEEILDYVTREMTGDHGAFYSATDADTMTPGGEKEEGFYFTWTPDELKEVLDSRTYEIIKTYYSIGPVPDFEGRHILHITRNATEVATSLGITEKELETTITNAKDILYHTRNKREKPFTDTKILTSWNGLMISGFARAGLVLNNPEYTKTAVRAAEFIFTSLMKDGRLLRTFKDGQAKYNAYLDDYAFLEAACIDLYEATSDISWLERAISLDETLVTWYADTSSGGFFMTSSDHETLLAREKPGQDGALPSSNSIAILNMLRLYTFTTDTNHLKRSEKAFQAFSKTAQNSPAAYAEMLLALDYYYDLPKEILIVTPENSIGDADPFLEILRARYIPNRIISVVSEGEKLEAAAKLIPLLVKKTAINGKTTVFVCEKGMCLKPSQTPDDFIINLGS